jgi:hypothetical protein
MSYIQKLLDNIQLNDETADMEIELKFLLDPRIVPSFVKYRSTKETAVTFIRGLITKFKGTSSRFSLEETMNFIQRGDTNFIKQLVFENGEQIKSKKNYSTKIVLNKPTFMIKPGKIPVKFSMSQEQKIDDPNIKFTMARCKLRLSIYPSNKFPAFDNWRLDITLVKSVQTVSSIEDLKRIRNKLFPKHLTVENFAEEAEWKYVDSIELEVEALDASKVTEQSIAILLDELDGKSGPVIEKNSNAHALFSLAKIMAPRMANSFKPPHSRSFRTLSNNVVELNKYMFFSELKPNIEKFLITDKADGFRVFLHLKPQEGIAIVVSPKITKQIQISKSNIKSCVADAEMVGDSFLVFDVMQYDGKNIYEKDFEKRSKYLEQIANLDNNIYAKKFVDAPDGDVAQVIKSFYDEPKQIPYETDGIIFTSKKGDYRRTKNYKWKSTEDTTIDFLVRKCPGSLLGIAPYVNRKDHTLYLLFCGIDGNMKHKINLKTLRNYKEIFSAVDSKYSPIQFSPSSKPNAYLFWHKTKNVEDLEDLDGKIVELHFNIQTDEWRLHKIRDDKSADAAAGVAFGNDFRIAELIFQNYYNPITMEDLKVTKEEGLKNVYFKEHQVDLYKPMRSYNSFVKEKLFLPHENIEWAVDLGSGKGQDLFRYIRSGIKNVLFVDQDEMALNELINRKYSFANVRKNQRDNNPGKISLYVAQADLNKDYKDTLAKFQKNGIPIPGNGVPLVVCNLALHYLIGTKKMRTNLVKLVDSLLASGGRFIFTAFDGETVFNLLKEHDGKWDQTEGEALKFSLRGEYVDVKFTGENQKIKVLQPFSDNTYYSEYLVKQELLQKEFKKVGMTPEIFESFDIYQDEFKKHNSRVYGQLSDLDKTYSALYHANSYYKA